ncbi:MAG TPA: DMT family transporter [Gaiellaceae bacterium]|nr:DMT family transporter [Gaiellaceae bacterium]
MSGGTAVAVALASAAGLAGSVQAVVMGRLGERVGSLEALAFATVLSVILAVALLLATRRSLDGLGEAAHAPAWMWAGGVLGVFIVFTITFATPRLGATATIGILIAGQLLMGAAIDRFGLFGIEQIGLTWPRLLGILLLAAGAALSLHKAT